MQLIYIFYNTSINCKLYMLTYICIYNSLFKIKLPYKMQYEAILQKSFYYKIISSKIYIKYR